MKRAEQKNVMLEIQDIVMRELQRLDDNDYMDDYADTEIARSSAISKGADTILKSINTGLKVREVSDRYNIRKDTLEKELGITNE